MRQLVTHNYTHGTKIQRPAMKCVHYMWIVTASACYVLLSQSQFYSQKMLTWGSPCHRKVPAVCRQERQSRSSLDCSMRWWWAESCSICTRNDSALSACRTNLTSNSITASTSTNVDLSGVCRSLFSVSFTPNFISRTLLPKYSFSLNVSWIKCPTQLVHQEIINAIFL